MDFQNLIKNLEEKGYKVKEVQTKEEAADYLDASLDSVSIGIGGSLTVEELNVYDRLIKHNEVYWHWNVKSDLSPAERLKKAAEAKIYLTSANGVAETGEIVNIDGNGNRVAGTIYGHEKVIFIIGENKVAENLEKAIYRARNVAAPLNAKRLGRKTPCAKNGDKCYDCKSPERICRALSVFWTKPYSAEMEVILVRENLGY